MPTPTGGREDISDLLGMRTRGAWLIIGSYLSAMVIVTVATVNSYTTPWVAALGPVILIAATLALVLVPGDPLPFGTTLMLTASGPVACALVLSATPAVLSSPLQIWIHGGGTSIYCFMNVRGRRIAPWIGLLGMVLVFAAWAVADGRGAAYGISFVAIDAAPLAMATLLSFTLRPTAKAVFSLRAQTTERVAELAAQTAGADEREKQSSHLDRLARPMIEKIASGETLTRAEQAECALLEAHLRDRLRAPILSTLELDEAAYSARQRGVEVIFLDDSGTPEQDPAVIASVRDAAAHALQEAAGGRVCVRMWPSGRETVASVLVTDSAGTRRTEITADEVEELPRLGTQAVPRTRRPFA